MNNCDVCLYDEENRLVHRFLIHPGNDMARMPFFISSDGVWIGDRLIPHGRIEFASEHVSGSRLDVEMGSPG